MWNSHLLLGASIACSMNIKTGSSSNAPGIVARRFMYFSNFLHLLKTKSGFILPIIFFFVNFGNLCFGKYFLIYNKYPVGLVKEDEQNTLLFHEGHKIDWTNWMRSISIVAQLPVSLQQCSWRSFFFKYFYNISLEWQIRYIRKVYYSEICPEKKKKKTLSTHRKYFFGWRINRNCVGGRKTMFGFHKLNVCR